jgi:signal transduction histidine kinase
LRPESLEEYIDELKKWSDESREKAKDNVLHDLRHPVSLIINATGLLESVASEMPESADTGILNAVIDALKHASQDILTMADVLKIYLGSREQTGMESDPPMADTQKAHLGNPDDSSISDSSG